MASVVLAKRYLDPLATMTSEAQAQRAQDVRKKRKRGEADKYDTRHVTRLKHVHTEGFEIGQIWEQARRILDASREEMERTLSNNLIDDRAQERPEKVSHGAGNGQKPVKDVRFDINGFEIRNSESEELNIDDDNPYLNEDGAVQDEVYDNVDSLEGSHTDAETDGLTEDEDSKLRGDNDKISARGSEIFMPDKHGLNDGFFSIDDFNRRSEFLEQKDARGSRDNSVLSSDEDVDWDVDPSSLTLPSDLFQDPNSEDGAPLHPSSEDSGPTFVNGGANGLKNSDSASDTSEPADDDYQVKANSIMYADFFAPPARKAFKKSRALPKTQPPPPTHRSREHSTEEDLRNTISSVRRDLFDGDMASSGAERTDPADRHSSHQKRQAALAAEIHRLEAAAIAERDWTLTGEARAIDRPLNALLEEDLDFERVGKPVPVITSEVSEDIEALIKRRILARDFDEVVRRRPSNLVTGSAQNGKRGGFALDEGKPQQSLAESYEEEYLKTADPESYISKQDAQLKKQHEEIERLWADLSTKLDALSSWHYRPKPPSANITVVADVPTISVEDAQPTAGATVAASRLAPQEVYRAGDEVDKKQEVVTKRGDVVAKAEISREERRRQRKRQRAKVRKAAGSANYKGERVEGKGKRESKEVMEQLKRGRVKVIGRKGQVNDVNGAKVEVKERVKHGGDYKL